MSGRPLAITMRQARTLLKAANAEGGVVEVKIDGAVVRLIPAVLVDKGADAQQPVAPEPKGYF